MKSLFVVYTPYQLMNAINTVRTDCLEKVDFVFVHKNMEQYVSIAEKYVDGQVICLPSMYDLTLAGNWLKLHFYVLLQIIRKKPRVKKISILKNEYENLFVPSDDSSCRVIYHHLRKKNRQLKLSIYDDGIGTYWGILTQKKAFLSRVLYALLLEKDFYEKAVAVYCYNPELLSGLPGNAVAKKISNVNGTNIFYSEKNEEKLNAYIGGKVVFLDQGMMNDRSIDACFHLFEKYVDRKDVLIKKHPRVSRFPDFYDLYQVIDDGLPFEYVSANLNMEHALLVAHSSTAAITPFLLGIQKPFVLLLCNMEEKNQANEKVIAFFKEANEKLGEEYIKMPTSIDELEVMLQRICKEVKGIDLKKIC